LELCHPAGPRRAVDWRWRLANSLRNGTFPARCEWVDPWVERAVAYQDALDSVGGDPHHPHTTGVDPAMAEAHRLRLGDDRPRRWEVEARLLAGGDDAEVARRCGLSVDAVAGFTAAFFDVRPQLGHPTYIQHQAIGAPHDAAESPVGGVWRGLGYHGGPPAVDFLAAGAEDTGRIDDFVLAGPAAPQTRHARLRRMVVAALTLEPDPAAARRVVPLIEVMEELDPRAKDASCRPIDGSFAAMVAGLDLTPGRPERDEYGLDGGGESRPTEDDPRSDAGLGARADFGVEAPLRRVGS